ncbi:hypothetical protein F0562_023985 [Nyssa sinensis]|uniref:Uncharacterized protein n=1 Tax=Nyssa sinensis TaxID=561372 RepID=A0A5J5BHW7_9ASTE|nr:hypothetical protein F0562_023985 [Nyssa sinensis]
MGRHEPGSSSSSDLASESPNPSHSDEESLAVAAESSSVAEVGASLRSSWERTRTNGRAVVERREGKRRRVLLPCQNIFDD